MKGRAIIPREENVIVTNAEFTVLATARALKAVSRVSTHRSPFTDGHDQVSFDGMLFVQNNYYAHRPQERLFVCVETYWDQKRTMQGAKKWKAFQV